MLSWLVNVASACCRTSYAYASSEEETLELDHDDPLVWCKPFLEHSCGAYSFAACQANVVLENFSQVDTATNAILVGIYDGHGGPEAAQFVASNLFKEIKRLALAQKTISQSTLAEAFACTEANFLQHVRDEQQGNPNIVCVGTSCLVGVIWKGTLVVANLGDSRAVIGCTNRSSNKIFAVPLTTTRDHNANREYIRNEPSSRHEDNPYFVFSPNGSYHVKGILEISKSIGDAYMKHSEFQIDPSLEEFQLPAISSDPDLCTRVLRSNDQFLIFASAGFWDNLTSTEAVEIVDKYPKRGIARRLVGAAQKVAAMKVDLPYRELASIEKGLRRVVHDDMTVVVVFINHEFLGLRTPAVGTSIKGFSNVIARSEFASLDDLM